MTKFVRFKDSTTKREVMVNPDKVQLLEDATDNAGPKVCIILGPGQLMAVDGLLDEITQKLLGKT